MKKIMMLLGILAPFSLSVAKAECSAASESQEVDVCVRLKKILRTLD